jgi:hypothetical protein
MKYFLMYETCFPPSEMGPIHRAVHEHKMSRATLGKWSVICCVNRCNCDSNTCSIFGGQGGLNWLRKLNLGFIKALWIFNCMLYKFEAFTVSMCYEVFWGSQD